MPTIYVRVDDAILLNDLPGNAAGVPGALPPDQVISIPHNPSTAASPVGLAAGYRVAIYDEDDTHAPVFLGFAQPVANLRGVYSFTFSGPGPDAIFGTADDSTLLDGSHFLSARVQMIDPADNDAAGTLTPATGFGPRSESLEIVVDTVLPPAVFGQAADPNDGLISDSDTGVEPPNPDTISDNVTSDTTPTFWGLAEANAIIRVYADTNGNGLLDVNTDAFLGQDTAIPTDGTNQEPNGFWRIESVRSLNDPDLFPVPDGLRTIFVTAEDLSGNVNDDVSAADTLQIFIDTQGPQVTDVDINNAGNPYDLFDPKPSTDGPTPLVYSLVISFRDLPARLAPLFLYPALKADVASNPGHYLLVGDANGVIPIDDVIVINAPVVSGEFATATVELVFVEPLPDDRFTLTISDSDLRSRGQRPGRRDEHDPAVGESVVPERRRRARRRLHRPLHRRQPAGNRRVPVGQRLGGYQRQLYLRPGQPGLHESRHHLRAGLHHG